MEGMWNKLTWLSVVLSAAFLLLVRWRKGRNGSTRRKPPGPPGWPVIGNMLDLGAMPHQSLCSLRIKYGPVVWLRLGSVNTMVIQSAKAAAELFKNHDLPFSDRKVPVSFTALDYNQGALSLNNYGPYWRTLRRLYSTQLMVNKRINDTAALRQKCVDNMIKWIEEDARGSLARGGSGEVKISHFLFLMSFSLLGNLMLSRDLLDSQSEEGHEFFGATNKVMEWGGKPNVADFLPFLKWLDPLGIKRNMVRDMGRAMKVIEGFVKERMQERQLGRDKAEQDFLDALLDYRGEGKEEPDKISEKNAILAILEMFLAGSDTTSSTMEWTMAELLRNPKSMRKLKEELDHVIGPNRKVEESDINELPYLQAIVKEAFRLHPAAPLLLPRNTVQDTDYMGYFIPKDTQVFVNVWAIGRDQDSWDDPLSFKPERFLGSNIEYKGQHYELIPFGSGRRICVGYSLAHRVVQLGLATLLHSFDWELACNVPPENMDMTERMGITVRKLVPLTAIPKRRTV
ncbi:cytochrome P450, family 76, subfamily C, polypeptide 6 [Actinidia rufa]|uniref:Cytochrome P450, family 76, subfamily C, polypeptide 6 n=1 Tax=Actinidia rufa TaxID=165716 RepID=A0A7J0E9V7_9ERIC|nr:cytochrome P450, family 76, subfamily C, polypeptide 6 [Actinidia rufa]